MTKDSPLIKHIGLLTQCFVQIQQAEIGRNIDLNGAFLQAVFAGGAGNGCGGVDDLPALWGKFKTVIEPGFAQLHPFPALRIRCFHLLGTGGDTVLSMSKQVAFKGHP